MSNAYDKKAEWAKSAKDVENAELQQSIKNTLANTKGKHGRRTIQQEEQSIDDILIADHLDKHISFSIFLRAICGFAGKEYKYDPAQRVDTFIYQEEKNFYTSKNSKAY